MILHKFQLTCICRAEFCDSTLGHIELIRLLAASRSKQIVAIEDLSDVSGMLCGDEWLSCIRRLKLQSASGTG